MMIRGVLNLMGLLFLISMCLMVFDLGEGIWFIVFMVLMISNVLFFLIDVLMVMNGVVFGLVVR